MKQEMTYVMGVTASVGFTLNLLVLRTFVKKKRRHRNNADKFITSLAFADITFCLCIIVSSIIELTNSVVSHKAFEIYWNISQGTSFSGSLLHIMVISIDRLVAVTCPFKYKKGYISSRKVSIVILSMWLLSAFIASTQFWVDLVIIDIIISCMISLASIGAVIIYLIIGHSLYKRAKNISTDNVQRVQQNQDSRKSIALCFLLTLAFFSCNMPFVAVNINAHITGELWSKVTGYILYYLMTINCLIDPIIYNFASKLLKCLDKKWSIKPRSEMQMTELSQFVSNASRQGKQIIIV